MTVMDADPNHPIKTWAGGGNTPGRLSIVSDANEDTIMCELLEHALDALETVGGKPETAATG